MPTIPPLALLAFAILLILLAACHFFQGRRRKNHAPSRKGPDDASPLLRLTTALLLALPGMLITGSVRIGPVAHGQAAPDNTKTDQGAPNKGPTTADQQKMNTVDQYITKQIRSSIVKDKSLSTYAHNIKISSGFPFRLANGF